MRTRLTLVLLIALLNCPQCVPASEGSWTSPAPVAPDPSVETAPSPPAGPVVPPEEQLAQIMKLYTEKKPAEAFSEAERFFVVDDRPPAQRQEGRRAHLILGKLDEIKKSLPQPATAFDNAMAQLLFSAAKALEGAGESAEAVKVYEKIIAEYPKAQFEGESNEPIVKLAQEQLAWHREKHPWVQPTLGHVVSKLREALTKHDSKALAALIARKGFWSGPFQSEGGPDDPGCVLKQLEAAWPKGGVEVAAQSESFSDPERQIFLKTARWTGQYPEIYIIIEKAPSGGWHWSAVAFALPPGKELPDEPTGSAEGGGPISPSPSPKK